MNDCYLIGQGRSEIHFRLPHSWEVLKNAVLEAVEEDADIPQLVGEALAHPVGTATPGGSSQGQEQRRDSGRRSDPADAAQGPSHQPRRFSERDTQQAAQLGFGYAASPKEAIERVSKDLPNATVNVLPAGGLVFPLLAEAMKFEY